MNLENHLRTRCGSRAFTVLELGVALGVMAIMIIGVIASRGYIEAAKVGSTVQMVDTFRKSARAYAERFNGSQNFNGVSIDNLRSQGLLTGAVGDPYLSPFDSSATIFPDANPVFVNIQFTASDGDTAADCARALVSAGTVVQAGTAVTVTTK